MSQENTNSEVIKGILLWAVGTFIVMYPIFEGMSWLYVNKPEIGKPLMLIMVAGALGYSVWGYFNKSTQENSDE